MQKIKLTEKEISTVEAEKIIANFNKSSQIQASQSGKEENKGKKIDKKDKEHSSKIKSKVKKVSKK